ncbi:AraC family transcriptional regulator ligand-binding domain-containing protein [Rhodococcus sp. IEGM 1379]|uniref:AraC family transcriptional regulator ligand-binding domain-containing protein n=1 Tax=Rhodococcus sp. IEGM 1379 TaxID=3047086 RepID=UPI0024B806CC|nr:AraC family transcriptional regulator ligand-binding domain-containing protein [Rhodococcus sp. IEGM 1379]MDI9915573.1 AraC family transcriptional regulator ligand-binding domain-containing protein [Rhodococcus sp. IEGM 1379]
MDDLIRASSLANFISLVDRQGGDGERILSDCGIDPEWAGNHDKFIRYTALSQAVHLASTSLGKRDFGIQLAQAQGADILGPVAVLARHAGTIGEGIDDVARYLHTYSPAVRVSLRRDLPSPQFRFEIVLRSLAGRDLMVELSLGIALELLRLLIDPDFVPERTGFAHAQICRSSVYGAAFGSPVEFETEGNFFELPSVILNKPTRGGDAVSRRLVEQYLSPISAYKSMVDQVADFVHRLLPLNQATLVHVARAMAVHPRTLQRQIAREGSTFSAVLDDVRRKLALRLVGEGLSANQISASLGYSEQSCYTRACWRWFGETPLNLASRSVGSR